MGELERIDSLNDWADAIVGLPADGPLPERLVVVPNERIAHALRRRLVEREQAEALLGTRFASPMSVALEVLRLSACTAQVDAAALAPEAVGMVFDEDGLKLEKFVLPELREIAGWDRAFARTIAELEADGLEPEALLESDDTGARDVGRIWQRLRPVLGEHWFAGRAFTRAMNLLAADGSLMGGQPIVAVVNGAEPAAQARFVASLPGVTLGMWSLRPHGKLLQTRAQTLYGKPPAPADPSVSDPDGSLGRVQAHMFVPELPDGPASHDDSVEIATFAGLVDELDATVCWVAEQVAHGTPTADIAVLFPNEGYAPLVTHALSALPWPDDSDPTLAQGGLPLTDRADGARLLTLLTALHENLPRAHVAKLLSTLRDEDGEPVTRGLSEAIGLLCNLPALGGSIADAQGALSWDDAHGRAMALLTEASAEPDDNPARARGREEAMAGLTRLAGALGALQALAAQVVEGKSIQVLWPAIRAFAETWMRLPSDGAPAVALIEAELGAWLAWDTAGLSGHDTVERLRDILLDVRIRDGRFGQPRIYVGTLESARMLEFEAVRVLGLSEGTVPSNARQDAVLDDERRGATSMTLPTTGTRVQRQLSSLYGVIAGTRARLALSTAREGVDGGQRQPAAVLLDVAACLTGTFKKVEAALDEAAARGRHLWRTRRAALPLSERAWLDRAATTATAAPHWKSDVCGVQAIEAISLRSEPSGQDGLAGDAVPVDRLTGLSPERPISASRLETLVQCPHQFALEHLLYFKAPAEFPSASAIDPMPFGNLVHGVAEDFFKKHGEAFSKRDHDIAHWISVGHTVARTHFDQAMEGYPLASSQVEEAQRAQLLAQVEKFLRYDWNGNTEFVSAERSFGYGDGLPIDTDAGPLYLHGSIDRLDREDDHTVVRDIKSGKAKPRRKPEDPPDPEIDLQLGVYAEVTRTLATQWDVPSDVAVSYVYLKTGSLERRWQGADAERLRVSSQQWLAVAREVLDTGAYMRSPIESDCQWCEFKPICALERPSRAEALEHPDVPERLRVLKCPPDPKQEGGTDG